MRAPDPAASPHRALPIWAATALAAAIVAGAAAVLLALGRTPWCTCGAVRLWTGDTMSAENSQQLLDPYTFTHVTHGVLWYLLLHLLAPRWSISTRAVAAIGLESAWEVLENTDMVIQRYRATTMALGYYGDSVLNSIGDIIACAVGFAIAARLPTRATIALVLVLEASLTVAIRDGLLLNIIMLVHPIEAVKNWQLGDLKSQI